METLVAKEAKQREKQEDQQERKRLKGTSTPEQLEEIKKNVQSVVTAIQGGYSPMKLSKAYVLFGLPDLKKKGAVSVMVVRDGYHTTPDYDLFQQVMYADGLIGAAPGDWVYKYSAKFKTVDKAIPSIVADAVADGTVKKAESARLVEKWSCWMKGVSWRNCIMHATHRPSLGSWEGWPWDFNLVLPRALRHFRAANVQVVETGPPEEEFVESFVKSHVHLIWSAEGGVVKDLVGTVQTAYEANEKQ
eukprot:TRINITY_DN112993_c0_g1_i1.p1 TRINITY_DN112993_c0_g1~~TRINITY_DN112993_c0_g1_i1.p1  ORF type:complete len:286 (-),score=37.61 TRINITY_DN112993_c0_g1_i1:110-850(-)